MSRPPPLPPPSNRQPEPLMTVLKLDHHVLDVDGQPVTLADVLAAARLGGWLSSELNTLRDKLACQALAETEGLDLDIRHLQTAIDGWRRARNLSAAEETEAMFATYRTNLDALVEYTRRTLYHERLGERLAEARERCAPGHLYSERLLPQELIFLHPPEALIDAFSLRVVAEPAATVDDAERIMLLTSSKLPAEHWQALLAEVYGLPPPRADWLLLREIAYQRQRQTLINEENLYLEFNRNPMDWVRLEVSLLEVADKDVARELLCCVREDQETLMEAAAHARLRCQTESWFFSDLEALPFGTHLPSARPLEAFGPATLGDHYLVLQLNARHETDLNDATTRARLEKQLIERALRKQAAQRVQFVYTHSLR